MNDRDIESPRVARLSVHKHLERYMQYHLTEHARDALAKRRIAVEWMEQVLAAPDWTEQDPVDPDLEHRLGRIADFGDRVLRVIVNVNVQPPRVVTTYFDRRRKHR